MMEGSKVVFLVDSSSPEDSETSAFQQRQLCLAISRILLCLSYSRSKSSLKWNYRLFSLDGTGRGRSSVGLKTDKFLDVSSSSLASCFVELQSKPLKKSPSVLPPCKLLYEALTSLIHEFPWDIPDIASPVKRTSGRFSSAKRRSKRKKLAETPDDNARHNLIFILGRCPHSSGDLAVFTGSDGGRWAGSIPPLGEAEEELRGLLLPKSLLVQLNKLDIGLHWVDTTSQGSSTTTAGAGVQTADAVGLSAVLSSLASEGGSVVSVGCLALAGGGPGRPRPPQDGQRAEDGSAATRRRRDSVRRRDREGVGGGGVKEETTVTTKAEEEGLEVSPTTTSAAAAAVAVGPPPVAATWLSHCLPPHLPLEACLRRRGTGRGGGGGGDGGTVQFGLRMPGGAGRALLCRISASSLHTPPAHSARSFSTGPPTTAGSSCSNSHLPGREISGGRVEGGSDGAVVGAVSCDSIPLRWLALDDTMMCTGYCGIGSSDIDARLFGSSDKDAQLFGSSNNDAQLFGSSNNDTRLFGSSDNDARLLSTGMAMSQLGANGMSCDSGPAPCVGLSGRPKPEASSRDTARPDLPLPLSTPSPSSSSSSPPGGRLRDVSVVVDRLNVSGYAMASPSSSSSSYSALSAPSRSPSTTAIVTSPAATSLCRDCRVDLNRVPLHSSPPTTAGVFKAEPLSVCPKVGDSRCHHRCCELPAPVREPVVVVVVDPPVSTVREPPVGHAPSADSGGLRRPGEGCCLRTNCCCYPGPHHPSTGGHCSPRPLSVSAALASCWPRCTASDGHPGEEEQKGDSLPGSAPSHHLDRVHSKRFQALLILLAQRDSAAVVAFGGAGGSRRCGPAPPPSLYLLQPLSSLTASLVRVRTDRTEELRLLLEKTKCCCGCLEHRRAVDRENVSPPNASLSLPPYPPSSSLLAASDRELFASLRFLLEQQHQTRAPSNSRADFAQCLLPWFQHHPHFGVDEQAQKEFERVQRSGTEEAKRGRRRAAYLQGLRVGSDRGLAPSLPSSSTLVRPAGGRQSSRAGGGGSGGGQGSLPTSTSTTAMLHNNSSPDEAPDLQNCPVTSCNSHVTATAQCACVEDLVAAFKSFSSDQVAMETEPEALCSAVRGEVGRLQGQLLRLGAGGPSLLRFARDHHLLPTAAQLKAREEPPPRQTARMTLQLFLNLELVSRDRVFSQGGERDRDQDEEEEGAEESEAEEEDCGPEETVDRVCGLCRSLLFRTPHGAVGKLFKDTILPSYGDRCPALLCSVYEELTWPVPGQLGGDEVHNAHADSRSGSGEAEGRSLQEQQESDSPLQSSSVPPLPLPLAFGSGEDDIFAVGAPRAPASTGSSVRTAPLQRHLTTSSVLSREITVASKDRRKKLNRARSTVGRVPSHDPEPLSVPAAPSGVKRSLFSRSSSASMLQGFTLSSDHSPTAATSSSLQTAALPRVASSPPYPARKRFRPGGPGSQNPAPSSRHEGRLFSTPEKKKPRILGVDVGRVMETPPKKQVSNPLRLKIQRARSKSNVRNVSPDVHVTSVSETPKRSTVFYSGLSGGEDSVDNSSALRPRKKDPSPHSLKDLLRGKLGTRQRLRREQSLDQQVEVLLTDIIEESPPERKYSISSSGDGGGGGQQEDWLLAVGRSPTVLPCTPLKTGPYSSILAFETTPTPAHHCTSLLRPTSMWAPTTPAAGPRPLPTLSPDLFGDLPCRSLCDSPDNVLVAMDTNELSGASESDTKAAFLMSTPPRPLTPPPLPLLPPMRDFHGLFVNGECVLGSTQTDRSRGKW